MSTIRIITNKPIAFDSPDHAEPWGTARDNSTNVWFNKKLQWWLSLQIRVLDLGCSGGGFVESIIRQKGFAVGLEGSDYSQKTKRAAWGTIPENLFTTDITEPFKIVEDKNGALQPLSFDVITAWEVMEHIREDKLPAVFDNILRHLSPGGIVIFSISSVPEAIHKVVLHQTVKSKEWWFKKLQESGFVIHESPLHYFEEDWVRGGEIDPSSFNVVLTKTDDMLPCRQKLFFLSLLAYPLNFILKVFRGAMKSIKSVIPHRIKESLKTWIKP